MDNDQDPLEFNVFGLSFCRQGAIAYFVDNLPAEAVGLPSGNAGLHEFYLALLDFYRRTGLDPVEPIAFLSWLESETEIATALGGYIVAKNFVTHTTVIELSTPEAVAKVLKDRHNTRKQLNAIEELKRVVGRKEVKTEEDSIRLSELTAEIRQLGSRLQYNPYDSLETAKDLAARAGAVWDLPHFLPTPFKALNLALGYSEDSGVMKGCVTGLCAKSGLGKSTLARCFMQHWVDVEKKRVLFVNYEEARDHWERVLFTQITERNPYKKDTPQALRTKYNKVYQDKLEEWGDRFMVKHDPDTPYFDDLEQWLWDLAGYNGNPPDAVIIDTIQSMFVKGSGNKPRWGQFEEIMVRLEKLAKDLNTAIVITSQENANRMKEKRDVVQQSDAGGSLTIIQKCSVVIFIVQKREVDKTDATPELLMELQIPKNRITGTSFMQQPPLVMYDDNIKSFVAVELPTDDEPVQYENFMRI